MQRKIKTLLFTRNSSLLAALQLTVVKQERVSQQFQLPTHLAELSEREAADNGV